MAFYQRGDVRIAYEEAGKGFPLLIIAGGGLNSTIEWAKKSAPFNAMSGTTTRFTAEAFATRPVALSNCRSISVTKRPKAPALVTSRSLILQT